MIKGYSKAFRLEQALYIYEQMKGDTDPKVYPNNVTYNSLLDCCVRCFDMATASSIFEEMTDGGCKKGKDVDDSKIKPDLISYSTMIKGFCKEKNIEQAFYMLEVMDK